MDTDKTPALPGQLGQAEIAEASPWDESGLERLPLEGVHGVRPLGDGNPAQGEASASFPMEACEVLDLEPWMAGFDLGVRGERERTTLIHLILVPSISGEAQADPRRVAEIIAEIHHPVGGVGVTVNDSGAPCLVFGLPDGVSWSTVATTAEHAGGEAGVAVFAGLADAFVLDQSLDDAVRMAGRAAEMALETGEMALARSLADEQAEERESEILASLLASLESGEGLRLVFQPKFDAGTREIVGGEALLRHECENLGSIGPAEFLPLAARAGILRRVERWVVGAAIDAIAEWEQLGVLRVPISINVAPVDFLQQDFAVELQAKIEEAGIDPGHLRIEVAEAGVIDNIDLAVERLAAVQDLGVSVALDDFGAAENERLTDLSRLPIDVLKVHRSFVMGMESSKELSALVRGVISLAGALGIQTVAAGVETEEQLAHLASYGCDAVQGYLLSKPLERSVFEDLCSKGNC